MKPISDVLVVGGDCAGLLAAVNLRAKLPQLRVQVLRHPINDDFSPEGFAASSAFVDHLHEDLRLPMIDFVRAVRPTWRLGTRYEWGPRDFFDHTCEFQIDTKYEVLSRETGFYVGASPRAFEAVGEASALMSAGRAFVRATDGRPLMKNGRYAYHLERAALQRYLENLAMRLGVTIRDGRVTRVMRNEAGISSIEIDGANSLNADLFIDATGLQSLLLAQMPATQFENFSPSLPCDRAVIATSPNHGAIIKPHTSVRTMDAGWSWHTEHERFIACGYAFSSRHIDGEQAVSQLRAIYPECGVPRIISFSQRRAENCWAGNVVAVGNASFFIEPLTAAASGILAFQCQWLAQTLVDCEGSLRPTLIKQFNKRWRKLVDTEREFLGLFYRFNTRLQTPFWQQARQNAWIGELETLLRCYQEIGPDSLHRAQLLYEGDLNGLEGYFSVLVGQCVPWVMDRTPSAEELAKWPAILDVWRRKAASGFTVNQLLELYSQREQKPSVRPHRHLSAILA